MQSSGGQCSDRKRALGGAGRMLAFVVGTTLATIAAITFASAQPPLAVPNSWNSDVHLVQLQPGPNSEKVEADVSTRSVSITSSFTGVEIVVFGAIDNARSAAAEAGVYDVVVIVEGARHRLTARRKTNTAGIWVNTQAVTFDSVPSYYAIASTRPLDEIADPFLLSQNDIGFARIPMQPVGGWQTGVTSGGLADFKSAVVRLKQRDGLYVRDDFGVVFVGRNLFRTTIDLPANVPVGPLVARVHLFRDAQLVDTFTTQLTLERSGLERLIHGFAYSYPLLFGLFTVMAAVLAGLAASTIVKRGRL